MVALGKNFNVPQKIQLINAILDNGVPLDGYSLSLIQMIIDPRIGPGRKTFLERKPIFHRRLFHFRKFYSISSSL